jgi:hypothetical protein
MNKILTVTNGIDSIDVECTPKIHTRVSEECIKRFYDIEPFDPEEVVLYVLLDELKITEITNWRFK